MVLYGTVHPCSDPEISIDEILFEFVKSSCEKRPNNGSL
jgi:hypothetical protein